MYTWEIENLLRIKNYLLYSDEYLYIIRTSPQIKKIQYNAFDDSFETWTKESDQSTNYFKYKVRKRVLLKDKGDNNE